jgi:hypothetical protein
VQASWLRTVSNSSRLHADPPCRRAADVPQIDVELIQSGHHRSGVGEPPSTVVAPANGQRDLQRGRVRLRNMPMTPEAILDGLPKKGLRGSFTPSRWVERPPHRITRAPPPPIKSGEALGTVSA